MHSCIRRFIYRIYERRGKNGHMSFAYVYLQIRRWYSAKSSSRRTIENVPSQDRTERDLYFCIIIRYISITTIYDFTFLMNKLCHLRKCFSQILLYLSEYIFMAISTMYDYPPNISERHSKK